MGVMQLTKILALLLGFSSLSSARQLNISKVSSTAIIKNSSRRSSAKLYGYRDSLADEFPYMVLLQFQKKDRPVNGTDRCVGSIMSPLRVITACHCLMHNKRDNKITVVYAGVIYMSLNQIIADQTRKTNNYVLHPKCDYSVDISLYDIGFAQLEAKHSLTMTTNVQSFILPWTDLDGYRVKHSQLVGTHDICQFPSWVRPTSEASHTYDNKAPDTHFSTKATTRGPIIHDELKINRESNVIRVADKEIISEERCEELFEIHFNQGGVKRYPLWFANAYRKVTENGNSCAEEIRQGTTIASSRIYLGGPVLWNKKVIGVVSREYYRDKYGIESTVTYTGLQHALAWFPPGSDQPLSITVSGYTGIPYSRDQKPSNPAACLPLSPPGGGFGGMAKSSSKIASGRLANDSEFPYMVYIFMTAKGYGTEGKSSCGGSILTPYRVITACRCVFGWNVIKFKIIAGTNDYIYYRTNTQSREAQNFLVHPKCIPVHDVYFYDIAFVFLPENNPFMISPTVQRLPVFESTVFPLHIQRFIAYGTECLIPGWGLHGEERNTKLQVIEKRIIPDQVCECVMDAVKQEYPFLNNDKHRATQTGNICTEDVYRNSYETEGDIGGPLVCEKKVVGILSSLHRVIQKPPYRIAMYASMQHAYFTSTDDETEYLRSKPVAKEGENGNNRVVHSRFFIGVLITVVIRAIQT